MVDRPLSSDDLLRLQKDGLALVLAVHSGIRRVARPMSSIADFDQMAAHVKEAGIDASFAEVVKRWPNKEGHLIGAAIGIMVDLADHLSSPERTDVMLEKARQRADKKQPPFEGWNGCSRRAATTISSKRVRRS